jgi:uncharacterized protein (DUF1015 family)
MLKRCRRQRKHELGKGVKRFRSRRRFARLRQFFKGDSLMRIKPFIATRPPAEHAEAVASPPYDVVDAAEARQLAADRPFSFLRIVRSELELAETVSPYDEAVYQRAVDNFARFKREGVLARGTQPALFLYRLEQAGHQQVGLVTVSHLDDYDSGRIKRHEKTRKPTEDDRTRHVDSVNANTGPVFLTYRDQPAIDALAAAVVAGTPLYDFAAPDGCRHTVWEIAEADAAAWVDAFAAVEVAYVADGHHRAASAARVARQRRDADPASTGEEEYNWFLSVLFPAGQLRILPYNRVVQDLNGLSEADFLDAVAQSFNLVQGVAPSPAAPGRVSMYVGGSWYGLTWPAVTDADPVAALDVSVLQDRLLAPILGIEDPRNNPRIAFVGGVRGTAELERRVQDGRAAVAFSMYPVTIEQLLAVADADRIMPPKSTWFEPKLKSGLLIHELTD